MITLWEELISLACISSLSFLQRSFSAQVEVVVEKVKRTVTLLTLYDDLPFCFSLSSPFLLQGIDSLQLNGMCELTKFQEAFKKSRSG